MDFKRNLSDILIVGGNHHNTLGVVESLALKGIQSYVIISDNVKKSFVFKSKYVKKGWICPTSDEFVSCMLQNFSNKKEKTIVIATCDTAASILDLHYNQLHPFFILPVIAKQGELTKMMNKQNMSLLAQQVGLTIPSTIVVENGQINGSVEYPCITKAISSVEGTKENIKICNNEDELNYFLKNQVHCPTIQIQKFIDKEYEFQFLGCSLNSGKEIIIPGRTHIDRPNGIDNTFFLKFSKCEDDLKETIDKVKKFIQATGYSGLFSVEFLKGKDGKNYFTEMNFRNDGNAYCVTDSGVNLPYIWFLYNAGLDYSSEIMNISCLSDSYIMPEVYYTRRMLGGEVSFKEWFSNMKKATCFTTYFKKDKYPFFVFSYDFFNNALRKLPSKIFSKKV